MLWFLLIVLEICISAGKSILMKSLLWDVLSLDFLCNELVLYSYLFNALRSFCDAWTELYLSPPLTILSSMTGVKFYSSSRDLWFLKCFFMLCNWWPRFTEADGTNTWLSIDWLMLCLPPRRFNSEIDMSNWDWLIVVGICSPMIPPSWFYYD